MVSFVIEFLQMWEMGNVIFIDGCAYAPAEPLAFALTRAVCQEFLFCELFAVVSVLVLDLILAFGKHVFLLIRNRKRNLD